MRFPRTPGQMRGQRGWKGIRRGPVSWLAYALVAAVLVVSGPPVRAEGDAAMAPAARAHYEAGMAHYAMRGFAAAAREFAAAYAIDPQRQILFAEAQATRLGGDCPAATRLYEAFLQTDPPAQQVEATRLALARCRDVVAPAVVGGPMPRAGGASGTSGQTAAAGPAAGVTQRRPAAPPPAWWRDRPGVALAAGAVVAFGVVGGLAVAAARADTDANAAGNTSGHYEDRRLVAEDRARWAARVAALGLALGAGAAGRLLWVRFSGSDAAVGAEGRF